MENFLFLAVEEVSGFESTDKENGTYHECLTDDDDAWYSFRLYL